MRVNRKGTLFLICFLSVVFLGCWGTQEGALVGQPAGPYRLELKLDPPQPWVGQAVTLTYRVTDAATQEPISDLQILHERVVHTFIVSRDLTIFAHTHQEDFFPLTPQDLQTATFHFPHTFPKAGDYFIVSEFTYKNRSWVKHFTLTVKDEGESAQRDLVPTESAPDLRRDKTFGSYRIALRTSPDPLVAGHDTELVCHLTRDGAPVTNLGLYLGTEVHMATWRLDGEHFGHQHTYTPEMAAMIAMMRDHTSDPPHMAQMMTQMMVQLMSGPAKQVYTGPELPVHHVFPAPGIYKLFFECAPGGQPLVADFLVQVVEYNEGIDTTVHSIVSPSPLQTKPAS